MDAATERFNARLNAKILYPGMCLEICFISLMRHIQWLPVVNETILYAVLYALSEGSVVSSAYILSFETLITFAVYCNPFKVCSYFIPGSVASLFPDFLLTGILDCLNCFTIFLVVFWGRFNYRNYGYPNKFRLKFKCMFFLFVTFCIVTSPNVVCLYYILHIVSMYTFQFQNKSVHDLLLYLLLGMVYCSSVTYTYGLYKYLSVAVCYALLLTWLRLKLYFMINEYDCLFFGALLAKN